MRTFILGFAALVGFVACSSSSENTGGSKLPDTFGDCDASVCQVALSAFTKDPSVIPWCSADKGTASLSCSTHPGLQRATCGGLYTLRDVYGFPGDFFQCSYDAGTGKLVGAKWAPDSHPTQIAGTQPPDACAFEALCSDGGSDAATD